MTHSQDQKSRIQKDLVCGMDVFSETAQYTFEMKGETYYFCADTCRKKFIESPQTYLKQSSFFLARWWNNYLKRLNKVTNGKAQCCNHH